MNDEKNCVLTVAGIGSGKFSQITAEVLDALKICDCIAGYDVYINLIKKYFEDKEFLSTPMRREEERCRLALERPPRERMLFLSVPGTRECTDFPA